MATMTRTPLKASSPPEAVSAGGASSTARAHIPPRGEPRCHDDEIRNLLAQHEAETHGYQCRPDIRPDQSARFQEMWVDEDEPDGFDEWLARVAGYTFAACAIVGAVLIIAGLLK